MSQQWIWNGAHCQQEWEKENIHGSHHWTKTVFLLFLVQLFYLIQSYA